MLTNQEVYEKIKSSFNGDYELLDKYDGALKNYNIMHKKCGSILKKRINHFLNSRGCLECYTKKNRLDKFVEFKKDFENLSNEYEFVSFDPYKNKIEVTHIICGYGYNVSINNFKKGTRCPKCAKNLQKDTEYFSNEVHELTNGEFSVVGNYINSTTKINIKHNTCKNIINLIPASFIAGVRCSFCNGGGMHYNTDSYCEFVNKQTDGEYNFIGEYVNSTTISTFHHKKCNNIYKTKPSYFNTGSRCVFCFGNKKLTTLEFKDRIFKKYGIEYTVLGNYINNNTKIKIKHNICGHIYDVTPSDIYNNGRRCPKCFKNYKKDIEQLQEEINLLYPNEYLVKGEYLGTNKKIDILHITCKTIFYPTPSNLLRGKSLCKHCNRSHGEKEILNYLLKYDYKFKKEFIFNDCKDLFYLRFDFAILDEFDHVKYLVEFDGIQHYESVQWFGGEESFKKLQRRDKIKNEYCKKNNIPLIRIPYWEYKNIEKILNSKIGSELKLVH